MVIKDEKVLVGIRQVNEAANALRAAGMWPGAVKKFHRAVLKAVESKQQIISMSKAEWENVVVWLKRNPK